MGYKKALRFNQIFSLVIRSRWF